MKTVLLGDVVRFTNGGTPARSKTEFWEGSIPWITGADITDEGTISARSFITSAAVSGSSTNVLRRGTVILLTRTSVGKVGVLPEEMAINQDLTGITPSREVDTRYLVHFLRASKPKLLRNLRGATIKGISREDVASLEIALPAVPEQRRLAEILDRVDALRMKRQQAQAHLDALLQAFALELFEHNSHRRITLAEIADVSSGITKGRRTAASTRAVPYLAVANVQAGHLALDNVKSIDATDAEVQRYALQPGDLVLTEGGDPDKLGRGTLWRGEIAECIHQNHIFRVRLKPGAGLRAEILEAFLGSWDARAYFLRSAKQTTGIASINKTQLAALPVPLPPVELQDEFCRRLTAFRTHISQVSHHSQSLDNLFTSLQTRAFKGEL